MPAKSAMVRAQSALAFAKAPFVISKASRSSRQRLAWSWASARKFAFVSSVASVNALNPWKDSTLALNSSLDRLRSDSLPRCGEGLLTFLQLEPARGRRCGGAAAPSDAVDVERSRVDMMPGCGVRLPASAASSGSLARLGGVCGRVVEVQGQPRWARSRARARAQPKRGAPEMALRDAPSRDAPPGAGRAPQGDDVKGDRPLGCQLATCALLVDAISHLSARTPSASRIRRSGCRCRRGDGAVTMLSPLRHHGRGTSTESHNINNQHQHQMEQVTVSKIFPAGAGWQAASRSSPTPPATRPIH